MTLILNIFMMKDFKYIGSSLHVMPKSLYPTGNFISFMC